MNPPPHHPYFLSLKRSNVLLWHLIWTANVEPKTGIGVSKNVVFNYLNSAADFGVLRRLHRLSPEEAPWTSRWGVGELNADMHMRTCNCLIYTSGLQRKRSTSGILTMYFSMGSWCTKLSNYMDGWCPRKLNSMGGWVKKKVPSSTHRCFFPE